MPLSELASVSPVFRFPIGLLAAVGALFVMDRVMTRLPEGWTPPGVAAGVLTGTPPDDAPSRLAAVAHYAAGLGTGLLFVYLSLVSEWLFGGSSAASIAAAAAVLYVLMVAFFLAVPLPRAPGLDGARRRAVGRDWAIAAVAYLAVLVPVSVGLSIAVT